MARTGSTATTKRPGHAPARGRPRRWARPNNPARRSLVGWLFIAPFGVVFLAFLVAPLVYAFYLSLFSKGLGTGTTFSGIGNYVKAFTDPSFLSGVWFVVRFSVVLIPVQMAVSLAGPLGVASL